MSGDESDESGFGDSDDEGALPTKRVFPIPPSPSLALPLLLLRGLTCHFPPPCAPLRGPCILATHPGPGAEAVAGSTLQSPEHLRTDVARMGQ